MSREKQIGPNLYRKKKKNEASAVVPHFLFILIPTKPKKYIYLNEKVSHEYEIVMRPVVCLCTHVRESKGKGGRLHLLGKQQCMWVNL